MRSKSKLSVTIDNRILEEIEKVSQARNFSKSQLTEEALKFWLKNIQKNSWQRVIKKWQKKTRNLPN